MQWSEQSHKEMGGHHDWTTANAKVALMFREPWQGGLHMGSTFDSVERDSIATCTLGVLEPKPIHQKAPSLLLIGEPRA
jgi:hypothetical protein